MNGPARLTIVFCQFVMNDVRTHTAPPGSPMPPEQGDQHRKSQIESSGFEYLNGLRVR